MTGAVRRGGAAAARADGLAVAYVMAVVNAVLVCVTAFGVTITTEQQAAVITLANAVLVAVVHLWRAVARRRTP